MTWLDGELNDLTVKIGDSPDATSYAQKVINGILSDAGCSSVDEYVQQVIDDIKRLD